jgi:transposase InsO family protein
MRALMAKLRVKFLNGEIFYTLKAPQVLIERWRLEYNTFRPHRMLNYRPQASETSGLTLTVQMVQ